jgi:prevent-host-death family protein
MNRTVRYLSHFKPISYLKANAAEVLIQIAEKREPLVVTQNGEAKAVLQDLASFEETPQTLALLKVLALGQQDVEAGRAKPVADVMASLRAKRPTDWWPAGRRVWRSCLPKARNRIWSPSKATSPSSTLRPMPTTCQIA